MSMTSSSKGLWDYEDDMCRLVADMQRDVFPRDFIIIDICSEAAEAAMGRWENDPEAAHLIEDRIAVVLVMCILALPNNEQLHSKLAAILSRIYNLNRTKWYS